MLLFIPIKGHSERVPRKNFRMFGGVPLYKRCLYKFSKYEIWVDTDSDELIEEIEQDPKCSHVHVYRRDKSLVGDDVSVNFLIRNFIDVAGLSNSETVCQIHVTSPFLKVETVDIAYDLSSNHSHKCIVGTNVYKSRFWKESWNGSGYEPVNHNPNELIKTQDLPIIYEDNSSFYMFTVDEFFRRVNRISDNPYFFQVDFPENVDIDDEIDWDMAVKMEKVLCSD